jgi:hypothetical protein
MDIFTALSAIPVFGPYLPYFALLFSVAAPLATVIPAPPPAAGWVHVVAYRVVTVLAWNVGHAKNEGSK